MANPLPHPIWEPIAHQGEGNITEPWDRHFATIGTTLAAASVRAGTPISLTGQLASIAATAITGVQPAAGLYELKYYARVTQAATTSSSLTVTLAWTDHGVAQTYSGAAMVGNTTTTYQSLSLPIYLDAQTSITYSTAYASVGATVMQYELYVALVAVGI